MSTITTVMFDLSEVLIRGLLGVEQDLAPIIGQPEKDILAVLGGARLRQLCRGQITEQQYLTTIRENEKWPISSAELQGLIRKNFHHEVDQMPALIELLSPRYDLILVSDHAREWIGYIEQIHPFLQLFKQRIYSFETGRLKTEASCFQAILAALAITGTQSVFIDDNPHNVEQARLAGIHGILFRGRETLDRELVRLTMLVEGSF
jgi:FMN phosphatase YigB (HAD superfamily)